MVYSLLKIIFIIFIIINILIVIFIDPPDESMKAKHPYYAFYIDLSYNLSFIVSFVCAIYNAIIKKKLIFTLLVSLLFMLFIHYFSSKRKEPMNKKLFLLFWIYWFILVATMFY